ncbi:hypothetical protein CDAR_499471 [Caerostris darwini]|uniref:HNH homing endonuclease n=1 Tax=Caerostris darwini TaxID=1538125 RepID=A0AAV4SFU2_9ARAC|nr:hypothetical protein CDAR_499471 [Caerostris darwini]
MQRTHIMPRALHEPYARHFFAVRERCCREASIKCRLYLRLAESERASVVKTGCAPSHALRLSPPFIGAGDGTTLASGRITTRQDAENSALARATEHRGNTQSVRTIDRRNRRNRASE